MPNQPNIPTTQQTDDELDLRQFYGALLRYKNLIAKITATSLVLTALYVSNRKPVWEGQFEIVLANPQPASSQVDKMLQLNPNLANLVGIGAGSNELETEVEILASPSILKPVFDFVKQQKRTQGLNVQRWRYPDWLQSNLSIVLVKGTSVLELSYRDTDKSLVLPVIQKISAAYQQYSGRNRERGIKQGIEYLDQQIKIYSIQSASSLRAAQEYGIEQDLPFSINGPTIRKPRSCLISKQYE